MKDAILNICLKRIIIDEFAKKVPGKKKLLIDIKLKVNLPLYVIFKTMKLILFLQEVFTKVSLH